MTRTRPLYAIGDVHGDAERLVKLMVVHGLIDVSEGRVKWLKPGVIVLLMGDVSDAKSRVSEFGDMLFQGSLSDMWIFEFLKTAQAEAEKVGSCLYSLIGNHELLNVKGDFRFASPYHARDAEKRKQYFSAGRGFSVLTSMFLTSMTYNGIHYSHAGIPLQPSAGQKQIIGKKVSAALLQEPRMSHLEGLISHRDYFEPATAHTEKAVATLLLRRGLKKMVIGHNFTDGKGIVHGYGGRVVYIDVGISKAFSPKASAQSSQILYDPGDGDLQVLNLDGSLKPIPSRAS